MNLKRPDNMIMSSKLSNYAVLASRKGQTNLLSYDCRSVLNIILKIQETASASSVCETQFTFQNTNVIFCNNKIPTKTRLRRIFSSGFSASTECEQKLHNSVATPRQSNEVLNGRKSIIRFAVKSDVIQAFNPIIRFDLHRNTILVQ